MNRHETTKRHGRTIAVGAAALILIGIAIYWGWNTFAVEILAQSEIDFKHAVALGLLLVATASLIPLSWRALGLLRIPREP